METIIKVTVQETSIDEPCTEYFIRFESAMRWIKEVYPDPLFYLELKTLELLD